MKMNNKLIVFFLIFIWVNSFFWGCEDKFSIKYPQISMNVKHLDSLISINEGKIHRVELEVFSESRSIEWENITVAAQIYDNSNLLIEFALLDNGEASNGDFLQGDHVYSNLFNDSLFEKEGEYTVRFNVVYYNDEISMEKKIEALRIPPFAFHVINSGDTIPEKDYFFTLILDSGETNTSYNLKIAVLDTTGVNGPEIKIMEFTGVEFIQNQYQLQIDSTFGAGLKGAYYLRFDLSLNSIQSSSYLLPEPVYILNSAPVIETVIMPDTLKIPPSGSTVEDTIYVYVNDKRGINDIQRVYYKVKKPDGTYSGNGAEFDLQNNGTDPDAVAGDNIFSGGFFVDNSVLPGTYIFEFRTVDRVDQQSDIVAVPVVLY